jgi:hypothetical protein
MFRHSMGAIIREFLQLVSKAFEMVRCMQQSDTLANLLEFQLQRRRNHP